MFKQLSELQKDVLNLVKKGKTNEQIAEELNYSLGNVKKILRQLHKFFKTKNRSELVAVAVSLHFSDYL
jgi:DNA-binding CsgD family transcriptional regulator